MNTFTKLITGVALSAFASIASAVPITGSIGFNGAYTLVGGTNLTTATGINITSAHVSGIVTGSFADAGIAEDDVANYASFTYNPTGPVASIWSIAGFTFDLNQMNEVVKTADLLALNGTGVISAADFDDTYGKWSFTANKTGSNLTWSSSAAPEPALALLLATGLIGFGFARRARKSA